MNKPLIWTSSDKDDEDQWPKKVIGANTLYIKELNKLILIGGNFNSIENLSKNLQLNTNILKGIDKNIEKFQSLEREKIKYINEMVYFTKKKNIDLLIFDFNLMKWEKKHLIGKVPCARSFQKTIYIKPYIFLYGGLILGSKAENLSVNELYVLNLDNYEWKQIHSKVYPKERTDFTFNILNQSSAILFGGASSPSDFYYEDIWLFQFNGEDLFIDNKKEIIREYWKKLSSKGDDIGKVRAHSSEVYDKYLYVFGGLDSNKNCKNTMFRYHLNDNNWELLLPSGKPPIERCYHEMCLFKNYLFIYGGITGDLANPKVILSDYFFYNIKENVWNEILIGGLYPLGRIGMSLVILKDIKYHNPNMKSQKSKHSKEKSQQLGSSSMYNSNRNLIKSETILIVGGCANDNNSRIYEIMESDFSNKFFWNIRPSDYKEGINDDNFLLNAENQIHDYKERINKIEINLSTKESDILRMSSEIDKKKKEIFDKFGYIDDQSQSMDDFINDLEIQKNNTKYCIREDNKTIRKKQKLKYIVQRKSEKSLEFFCSTQNLFVKLYDTLIRARSIIKDEERLTKVFNFSKLNKIKSEFHLKLTSLKSKLEVLSRKEDLILSSINRYKFNDNILEVFKDDKLFENIINNK